MQTGFDPSVQAILACDEAAPNCVIRRIASDIAEAKPIKGSRFDPSGPWREAADKLPLSIITPVAVEDWRVRFIKERATDEAAKQQAVRSVNSYLGNAKSLFSRRVIEAMRLHKVELPNPLPFDGVRKRDDGSARYRSTINPGALLQTARTELAEKDPDSYAVVLLALGAGLRRAEIDGLQWQQVMAEAGTIRVMTTAHRRLKSAESEGDVQVDRSLFAELEATRRPGKTLFVVEPDVEFTQTKAAQFYRCETTFRRVTEWLRSQGVLTNKPLHTLRKEFGRLIVQAADIYQAQRQLRHSEISTTEAYYADARKRATVPIGDVLNPEKQEVTK
jgi:integrase